MVINYIFDIGLSVKNTHQENFIKYSVFIFHSTCFTEQDKSHGNFMRKNFYLLHYTLKSSRNVSCIPIISVQKIKQQWYRIQIFIGCPKPNVTQHLHQLPIVRRYKLHMTDVAANYYLHVNTQLAMNTAIIPHPLSISVQSSTSQSVGRLYDLILVHVQNNYR